MDIVVAAVDDACMGLVEVALLVELDGGLACGGCCGQRSCDGEKSELHVADGDRINLGWKS